MDDRNTALPESESLSNHHSEENTWSDLSSQITEGLLSGTAKAWGSSLSRSAAELGETVIKAAAEAAAKAGAGANDIPQDLRTIPEFKQVGADHGKPTASRTAGDWTITNHADGAEVWKNSANGTCMSKLKDGTQVTEFKDGNVTIQRPDGTSIARTPDGYIVYTRPDGSGVTQDQQGKQEQFKEDPKKDPYEGKEFKPMADGSKVFENDSVKVTRLKDGTQIEAFKNPPLEITTKADGTKITDYKDGTTITQKTDGSSVTQWKDHAMTQLPDGTRILDERKTFGFMLTTKPDGSSVMLKNDGTQVTTSVDGIITTKTPDGKITIERKK